MRWYRLLTLGDLLESSISLLTWVNFHNRMHVICWKTPVYCETTMIMLKCVWRTGFRTGKCTFGTPVVWSSMGFSHRGLLVSSWVILALHLIPINKTTRHTLFGWSPHATDWSKRHVHTQKGLLVRSWMETDSPFLCALTWVFSKRHWADFPTLSLFVFFISS